MTGRPDQLAATARALKDRFGPLLAPPARRPADAHVDRAFAAAIARRDTRARTTPQASTDQLTLDAGSW